MAKPHPAQRILLNVGGTRYETTVETLVADDESGYFENLVSTKWRERQSCEIFVDRDGEAFRHVLNWKRNGKVNMPSSVSEARDLLQEANYYCMAPLAERCRKHIKVLEAEKATSQAWLDIARAFTISLESLKQSSAASSSAGREPLSPTCSSPNCRRPTTAASLLASRRLEEGSKSHAEQQTPPPICGSQRVPMSGSPSRALGQQMHPSADAGPQVLDRAPVTVPLSYMRGFSTGNSPQSAPLAAAARRGTAGPILGMPNFPPPMLPLPLICDNLSDEEGEGLTTSSRLDSYAMNDVAPPPENIMVDENQLGPKVVETEEINF